MYSWFNHVWSFWITATALFVLSGTGSFGAEGSARAGADLFTNGPILRLRITLTPAELELLRRDSRADVSATLEQGIHRWSRVALHLKGSRGSFRPVDDKPSLTVNFDRFNRSERFHGLRRIHLNNSIEDPGYFNELAGAELFRAAGVPVPRVAHAVVELNGRRLGLYVLKEGFDEEFLGLHFSQTNGNLYDTGPGWDVDEALSKDRGSGPDDRSDLQALAVAAREPDLSQRWRRLRRALDTDRFISFMAMEVIACHRDGYALARNNYRIYHDPTTDRMVFLAHGMDQLFGRPDATIHPAMQGLVARAVMETSEGARLYRERLTSLATNALNVSALHRRADEFLARVRSVLEPGEAKSLEAALVDSKRRIKERRQFLEQKLSEPDPGPLVFENGVARVTGWKAGAALSTSLPVTELSPDGRKLLPLRAGVATATSWRTTALLPKGRYRFRAEVRTKGIQALSFGNNQGAGLRVVGGTQTLPYSLSGDNNWTRVEQLFELATDREVELICELRAQSGEAWFDLESLRLQMVP